MPKKEHEMKFAAGPFPPRLETGFATTQEADEEVAAPLFHGLDRPAARRYLTGTQTTEADWRPFTALVFFDPVFAGHFKGNIRRIADCRNLSGYVRDLYPQPVIAATVDLQHIRNHYSSSHGAMNPSRIVPLGPDLDYSLTHDRNKLD